MSLQEELFNRTQLLPKLDRNRVLSDNFKVYLYPISSFEFDIKGFPDNFKNKGIDLTQFSLTEFSWEARDEITIWKPAGNILEECRIERLGFNIEIRWAKNAPDLMQFLIDQHTKYYGESHINNKVFDAKASPNFDAERIYRSNVDNQKDVNQPTVSPSNIGVSSFNQPNANFKNKNNSLYLTPRFDLVVEITLYDGTVESYRFRSVRFFKPTQKTSQNSSEIEESCMAHSSLVMKNSVVKTSFQDMVGIMLNYMLQTKPAENSKPFLDRYIINPPKDKNIEEDNERT